MAFHKVTVSPSAVDLKKIEALALFYQPKLSIMAAEGISKLSGRGGLRRANKNIVMSLYRGWKYVCTGIPPQISHQTPGSRGFGKLG